MAIALVVLAIGAVLAGYVGVPDSIVHGGNRIETFLEPSFRAPAARWPSCPRRPSRGAGEDRPTEFAADGDLDPAGAWPASAWRRSVYLRRPGMADALAARFGGVHRLLLGKYFVDEAVRRGHRAADQAHVAGRALARGRCRR